MGLVPHALLLQRSIWKLTENRLERVIDSGFVPVLHKDAMLDEALDCTILGGDVIIMAKVIDSGFVPVLHKDAMLDEALDCTILGGDVIIHPLATQLKPEYIVFLTNIHGSGEGKKTILARVEKEAPLSGCDAEEVQRLDDRPVSELGNGILMISITSSPMFSWKEIPSTEKVKGNENWSDPFSTVTKIIEDGEISPVSIKEVGERVDLNRNEVRNDTLAEKALFVVLPLEEKGSLIQTASILKLWFLMGPRGRTGSDHYGPSKEGSSSVYSPRLRPPLLPACILHGHPHVLFSQNPRVSSPISPCMPSKIDFQKSCFRIILFLQLFILP
uniref:Uncharacterized protein n=1 Tax=Vitis vinifera TaxID=29760 RepID=A5AGT1_VITVI|nr:hypothetical protein VITISV_006542 [Vitis vinifera]